MTVFRAWFARRGLWLLSAVLVALGVASLFTGVGDVGASGAPDYLGLSRFPRTAALVLSGSSLALCGMIMQMLARNRFVEPSTAGTVDAAALGVVLVAILVPGLPVAARLGVAALSALAGTALFMLVLRRIRMSDPLVVPLVGIMLGGIIGAVTSYLALQYDLLQALSALSSANFAGVLQGRYELLWLPGALAVVAYIAADRFTVAGLGDAVTTNLGLNYRRVTMLGLLVVSITVAVIVVHVGSLPFLGLIVPNIVAMALGDNVRRTAPWIAMIGAILVLCSDLIGRLVKYPYEVQAGLVMSVFGAAVFLVLLLRPRRARGRARKEAVRA